MNGSLRSFTSTGGGAAARLGVVSTRYTRVLATWIIGARHGLSRGDRIAAAVESGAADASPRSHGLGVLLSRLSPSEDGGRVLASIRRRCGFFRVWICVERGGWRGHPVAFASPGAEVDVLAALTAEGPKRIVGAVEALAAAGGAANDASGCSGRGHEHKVNSKLVSAVLGFKRPSASCRINLTDTIRRWPLISGTTGSVSVRRTRSNW